MPQFLHLRPLQGQAAGAQQCWRLQAGLCVALDVQGNVGRPRAGHEGAALLEAGTQKGAASPSPEPVTRRLDPALGNVQLFVQGIIPRDPPQPPCPKARTEPPTPQPPVTSLA